MGANAGVPGYHNSKVLIVAATIVVLTIIVMYFRDQQQQRALKLRRLEKRVELLEERGLTRQNMQPNNASNQWPAERGLKFVGGQR
ncbi:MAG: hypothetical protein ACYS1A_10970 [Planctomycetota bacterium]|jgi:hypothetical protein